MAHVPDHIAARRARARARRRRRQIAALGTLLAALIAAIVIVIASSGGAATHKPHPGITNSPVSPGPVAPKRRMSALEASRNANIRKLSRLGVPVYCGGPHGHDLAFTFDDGPGVYTHYAVKKLTEAHERATFFVVGKSIEAWPGWLPRELRVGTLGDHTFTHPDLQELSPAQVSAELQSDKRLIERDSGQGVNLFRPPYGAQDPAINQIAKRLGLLDIMWSMDSRDSLGANWAGIVKNVESDLRPGAIILMHENRGQTIRALTTLLPVLHKRHLKSVSLPELFAVDPPSPVQVKRGLRACLGHPTSLGNLAGAG